MNMHKDHPQSEQLRLHSPVEVVLGYLRSLDQFRYM